MVDPPVVLAPTAGITNVAFRRLCRTSGVGLHVCETCTSRALVERDAATLHMITFEKDEYPRSMQIYGVDPQTIGDAVRMIVDEHPADHIDMNFGCPKSTHPQLLNLGRNHRSEHSNRCPISAEASSSPERRARDSRSSLR
jgi:tRNA-dihydrouridine synthase